MLPEAAGRWQAAFSSPRSQFFTIRTDPKPDNNMHVYLFFLAVNRLTTFSSPVKFSNSVFSGVKFRAKFEVVLQKQLLTVIANHSKSDLFTVN